MQFSILDRVGVVLVGTTHPGNIGAAARAMKTMRMGRLCLVTPRLFPSAESTARAAGADDVLAEVAVFDSLPAAVSDCVLVYGTSARSRQLPCPVVSPEQGAVELLACVEQGARAAVIFGREQSGLTNDELDLCNKMILIPGNPDFSSLNLAAAVQIICYELYKTVAESGPWQMIPDWEAEPVTAEAMEHLYGHLEACLVEIGFLDPQRPRKLMRRLKRLFNRAGLDQNEYNILRGILTSMQTALRNSSGSGG